MNGFELFVGGILPYLAVAVFLAGMIYRIAVWYNTPQPGKMTLYPTEGSSFKALIAESLFFPSLFRGDKALWVFAWTFHVALALAFIGHFRVITGFIDQVLMSIGMSSDGILTMSGVAGGAAGVVLLLSVVLLLFRRMFSQRVREISNPPDFFALIMLIAIILTGNWMRFGGEHFDLEQTRIWAASLLSFSPIVPANKLFLTHALLGQVLFIYIPFSKIMHFGGIFFTHALVKRR